MKDWRTVPKPEGVRALETDGRGYPVFYTVHRGEDGKPDFRVIDPAKRNRCARLGLCGICGEKLGYWICFVGGPLAAKNRAFGDAPMHRECADYALRVCPFLTTPTMQYAAEHRYAGKGYATDPTVVTRKPDRMCVYVTRGFALVSNGAGGYVFRAKPAKEIEWRGPDGRPLEGGAGCES